MQENVHSTKGKCVALVTSTDPGAGRKNLTSARIFQMHKTTMPILVWADESSSADEMAQTTPSVESITDRSRVLKDEYKSGNGASSNASTIAGMSLSSRSGFDELENPLSAADSPEIDGAAGIGSVLIREEQVDDESQANNIELFNRASSDSSSKTNANMELKSAGIGSMPRRESHRGEALCHSANLQITVQLHEGSRLRANFQLLRRKTMCENRQRAKILKPNYNHFCTKW